MGRYISCPRWGDFKLQVEIKLSINTLKETCYRFVAACINSINSRIDCFNMSALGWVSSFFTNNTISFNMGHLDSLSECMF